MKCASLYKVSKFALKAIGILIEQPGLKAYAFAIECWPRLQKKKGVALLAGLNLRPLCHQGLIRVRYPWHKGGSTPPQKRYYVTEKGYRVHDFYARKHASESQDPPHHHGTGGSGHERNPDW